MNLVIYLDKKKITDYLQTKACDLHLFEKIDSTNDYLRTLPVQYDKPQVCIAETQTHGKGRLQRRWYSPFGQNIYFSLLYNLQKEISELSGLSLVVGLAVCNAIEKVSQLSEPLWVKWPNDIISNQKKLGGILIEIQPQSQSQSRYCSVIIGVGINVNMQQASKQAVNQPWTSIRDLTQQDQDRNVLCAALIDRLLQYLERFNQSGLSDFLEEWKSKDYLYNKPVHLVSNEMIFSGIGAGIDVNGRLILTLSQNLRRAFSSGEATLMKKIK